VTQFFISQQTAPQVTQKPREPRVLADWMCTISSETLFFPPMRISIPGGAVGASSSQENCSQGGLFAKARAIIKCAPPLAQDIYTLSACAERPHLQFYKYVSVISLQLVCRAPHAAERAKKRELLKLECTRHTTDSGPCVSLKGGFSGLVRPSGCERGREHKVFRVGFIAFLKCR
jgi:hypothetical protein